VAGVFGIVISVLEDMRPQWKKYLPSPTGLGIAFYIAGSDSLAMFAGAVVAWWVQRSVGQQSADHASENADDTGVTSYIVPVSSGLIAGESLMGIVVAALNAFHMLGE